MVKYLITSLNPRLSVPGIEMEPQKEGRVWKAFTTIYFTVFLMAVFTMVQAFATSGDSAATVSAILQQMIDIIGMIFVAVGIILAIYSIGQLVLAFKNEDADSKSRASTLLVVSIILIAFPALVEGLGLLDYLPDV